MGKGFGGVPGNMQAMVQQAQKMQEKLMKAQKDAEEFEADASAGGGMVTIKANGKNQIVSVTIDPEVIDPKDPEMLQDLILAAANEALQKVQSNLKSEMSKIAGGINIPGLF